MKVLFILCFYIFSSYSSFALIGRIFIPKDENVLKKINMVENVGIDPYDIDVLVWNIYKGIEKNWRDEFFELSRGKELLIFQESIMHTRVSDELKRNPTTSYVFATSWYNLKYLNSETGVMTGATSKSISNKWQRSYFLEPLLNTPKMTLFTEYKLKGRSETLLVGNIHGINFVRAYKLRKMLNQAAAILKKHKGPAIFAGDFNTWTETKIKNMNTILMELGFKAVKFSKDIRKSFRGNPLDHAWVKGLKILSSEVPDSTGSDHKPMVMKLSI